MKNNKKIPFAILAIFGILMFIQGPESIECKYAIFYFGDLILSIAFIIFVLRTNDKDFVDNALIISIVRVVFIYPLSIILLEATSFPIIIAFDTIFSVVLLIKSINKFKESPILAVETSTPTPVEDKEEPPFLCAKCKAEIKVTDKHCPKCGVELTEENIIKTEETKPEFAKMSDYLSIYSLPEYQLLEAFIKQELKKAGISLRTKLIPQKALVKKNIFNIIFSILLFIYITLIFFHFPIYTYIIGLVILILFYVFTRGFDLIDYLKKEIKARPQEKISNIVMKTKTEFVPDTSKYALIISTIIAIVLPLLLFNKPRILYEETNGGYAVRYYIFGLSNFTSATIPETHNGQDVVTLRGNTFSNMPFLKKVSLPDTITEIRGQAFKNCSSLTEVNIPPRLSYLGGGAFANAKSIRNVELPDSLLYMGGEVFYGARSLEYITLSKNLKEIRGDSFEYCTSLKSITIPDSVTRIGGHAFYGDYSLSSVTISETSNLKEIGSSAFRRCDSLNEITIPRSTYVNERAFKESPTSVRRYGRETETDYNYNNIYNNDY